MAIDVSAHERVKHWRIARGLSQEELGRRCDLPQSKISRIESGGTTLTADDLEAIVGKGLKLTMAEFYGVAEGKAS
ncbi:MAG TPA: helix-turn-helix transcriptional regulator [Vicinamibacterales bacterium]|nr:helix-turn-helix transcriptional regulator [Vicinamibacterales bacterium]